MMRSVLLTVSVVALGGALLFSPVSHQSAKAQMLGALKASADSGNLVTLVRRGGGGRYAGKIGRYHGGNRHYGNRYHGKYYGNRYYGHRRYGYWPWIGVGAYRYGSTNCDWLYRHNYRRWLAVCQ